MGIKLKVSLLFSFNSRVGVIKSKPTFRIDILWVVRTAAASKLVRDTNMDLKIEQIGWLAGRGKLLLENVEDGEVGFGSTSLLTTTTTFNPLTQIL